MTFKLGILGGGLQGTEAASLARWAGWDTILVDTRPFPPAKDLAGHFVNRNIGALSDLDRAFPGCDLVIPACENLPVLELLTQWRDASGQPLAFDLEAYRVSFNKARSKNLFYERDIPTPRPYPEARYPVIAKPVSESGSRGVKLVNNAEQLTSVFPTGETKGWVVEEYCPGPSYSLEITGQPGGYQAWLSTYLEMDDSYDCCRVTAPAGLSEAEESSLRDISLNIADGLKLKGLMDVEVILGSGGFRVLEIDARLPSQTPTVVYWSSGVNLIAMLANIFCGTAFPEPDLAKAVIYEHVIVKPSGVVSRGEHIMSAAPPLWLYENFFGADWALSDYNPGASGYVATLIMLADSPEELAQKRAGIWAKIKER